MKFQKVILSWCILLSIAIQGKKIDDNLFSYIDEIKLIAEWLQTIDNDNIACLNLLSEISLQHNDVTRQMLQTYAYHALMALHKSTSVITSDEYDMVKKYLEYVIELCGQEHSDNEHCITRINIEYEVMFDLWVQHALRARLAKVDGNVSVGSNLSVGGTEVINQNLVVGGNTLINGNLTVEGQAFFNQFIIGCTGLLDICGTFINNGVVLTGPGGPVGPQGPAGPTGSVGPIGPQGPAGQFPGTTAPSLFISGTAPSNSCTSGALIVSGGVGIAGDLNVCGYINTFEDYEIDSQVVLNDVDQTLNVGIGIVQNLGAANTLNTYVGNQAGSFVPTTMNTFVGFQAGNNNRQNSNTLIGSQAGSGPLSAPLGNNTFIGYLIDTPGSSSNANNDVIIGSQAASQLDGGDNVIIGYLAANNSNGALTQSVVIGESSGQNAAGNQTFIGYQTGQVAIGNENTFIGYQAGNTIGSGDDNTFIGYQAGSNAADPNTSTTTCIGVQAGQALAGSNNVMIGNNAGKNAQNGILDNVFIGVNAGLNPSGAGNTFVGENSGNSNPGIQVTLLGFNTHAAAGATFNATALGENALVTTNNEIQLGAANTNVQVTTTGSASAGMLFSNPGSSVTATTVTTTFNFYQQDKVNFVFDWTGNGAKSSTIPVLFTRAGGIVNVTVPEFTISGASNSGGIISFNSPIPSQYKNSNVEVLQILPLVTYTGAGAAQANFLGLLEAGTGIIDIDWAAETPAGSAFVAPPNGSNFPDPGGSTVQVSSFSYSYPVCPNPFPPL